MTLPIRRRLYQPSSWYWVVAGSATQVYSSAAVAYVSVTDAAYVAWIAAGNTPSRIALEQDLWDVLQSAGVTMPVSATTSDEAKGYLIARMPTTVQVAAFYNIDSRLRVLEGRPAITKAQFLAGLKALLQ